MLCEIFYLLLHKKLRVDTQSESRCYFSFVIEGDSEAEARCDMTEWMRMLLDMGIMER